MVAQERRVIPDHTAVRVALWRALHLQLDAKPPVFADEVGLQLVGEKNWRDRPDMEPEFSKPMRAGVTGRARFVEDLVEEKIKQGVVQYVILGAGLDSFAQRRAELASSMRIFEIDQPETQTWKKKRLLKLGYKIHDHLNFVPVDFESGHSWWEALLAAGFKADEPATIVSTGVSMYLTTEANVATLKQIARMAANTTFAMTFMLALDLLGDKERSIMEFVMKRAEESRTPFNSLFEPEKIVNLAKKAGFKFSKYVPASEIFQRYFVNRPDGLRAGSAEAFLVATV